MPARMLQCLLYNEIEMLPCMLPCYPSLIAAVYRTVVSIRATYQAFHAAFVALDWLHTVL